MPKLRPREVDVPIYPNRVHSFSDSYPRVSYLNVEDFSLFLNNKQPFEPHYNKFQWPLAATIFLEISYQCPSQFISILSVRIFHLFVINEMKFFFFYIFELYVFLYFIFLVHKFGSVVSENSALSQSFFSCPQHGRDIRSQGSIWFNLFKISLVNPNDHTWGKKRKMRDKEILSKYCSRRPSRKIGI